MVRSTDRLNMTIIVDWDIKPQTKHTMSTQNKYFTINLLFTHYSGGLFEFIRDIK